MEDKQSDSIIKYLSTKTILYAGLVVIVTLCGVIITLKDITISDLIDKKIRESIDCLEFAPADAVAKLSSEKLDKDIYQVEQNKRDIEVKSAIYALETKLESTNRRVDAIGKKVDKIDGKIDNIMDRMIYLNNKTVPTTTATTIRPDK